MLVVNILGDLVAVYLGGDVLYVAVASIATFGLGTFMAYYYLRKDLPFKLRSLLKVGSDEVLKVFRRMGQVIGVKSNL